MEAGLKARPPSTPSISVTCPIAFLNISSIETVGSWPTPNLSNHCPGGITSILK
jgi:hypothetical protein